MRRIIATTTFLLVFVCLVLAQPSPGTFSIIPKLGVNISTFTGSATMVGQYRARIPVVGEGQTEEEKTQVGIVSTDHHMMRFGWTGGVEAQYQMTDRWALSFGAMYALQGAKYDDVNMNGITMTNASVNMHYINIPILLNYYVADGFAIKAGIQPGVCVLENGKCDIMADGIKPEFVGVADSHSNYDISVPVGIAYEFGNMVVDARYNIGVKNIVDGKLNGKELASAHNNVFMLTLGYIFDF